MTDNAYLEGNMLVRHAFDYLQRSTTLPQLPEGIVDRIFEEAGTPVVDELNDMIAGLLDQELSVWVKKLPRHRVQSGTGYGATIRKSSRGGRTVAITFYKIENSRVPLVLGIIGLTAGICLMSLTLPLTVVGLSYTLYKNVVSLHTESDEDAIAIYQAYLYARLAKQNRLPTTQEINEADPSMDPVRTRNALKTLESKGILKVASWAGTQNDWENPNNEWRLPL